MSELNLIQRRYFAVHQFKKRKLWKELSDLHPWLKTHTGYYVAVVTPSRLEDDIKRLLKIHP